MISEGKHPGWVVDDDGDRIYRNERAEESEKKERQERTRGQNGD